MTFGVAIFLGITVTAGHDRFSLIQDASVEIPHGLGQNTFQFCLTLCLRAWPRCSTGRALIAVGLIGTLIDLF